MQWFLPWTSQTYLFLLLQILLSPEGRSTELGEHQSSVMATTYLHFLLDAGCLCTFSVECESPFALCYQWFLVNLPIEIITSKPNGRSSASSSLIRGFVSHPLSTLAVGQGVSTRRLSPPHSARGRKLQNWQEGAPGLLQAEINILLIFTKHKLL